jgi:hypothetical protein
MAQKKSDPGIYDLLRDVGGRIGADRVGEVLSGLLDGAARSRGTLERNLENLLGYANIPSRTEYEQLVRVVEGLTASVERLGKRIDELAVRAAKSAAGEPASQRARHGTPKKAASRGRATKDAGKPTAASSGAARARKRTASPRSSKPPSRDKGS